MTRSRVRRALRLGRTHTSPYIDFFCVARGGLRVGYPSPGLLRTEIDARRRHLRGLRGRAVLVLTANPYYRLRGVHVGERLRAVARRLHTGPPMRIGRNTWYVCPNAMGEGVLKVRHGTIEEIGVAPKALTRSRRAALRFLRSFA